MARTFDYDFQTDEAYKVKVISNGIPGLQSQQHIPGIRLPVDEEGNVWAYGIIDLTSYAVTSLFKSAIITSATTTDLVTVPTGSTGLIITFVSFAVTQGAQAQTVTLQDSAGNALYSTTIASNVNSNVAVITLELPSVKLAPGLKLQVVTASAGTVAVTAAASARVY